VASALDEMGDGSDPERDANRRFKVRCRFERKRLLALLQGRLQASSMARGSVEWASGALEERWAERYFSSSLGHAVACQSDFAVPRWPEPLCDAWNRRLI
jgi:hypothetical protein